MGTLAESTDSKRGDFAESPQSPPKHTRVYSSTMFRGTLVEKGDSGLFRGTLTSRVYRTGWLANRLGPIEPENLRDMEKEGVQHFRAYEKMRSYPLGRTTIDVKHDIQWITGLHRSADEWMQHLYDMQDAGMIHFTYTLTEKERVTNLHITILDRDSIPEHMSRVTPGLDRHTALHTLLYQFAALYRHHLHHDYPRYGKDVSMAKKVLEKCGGDAHEAVRLARAFFTQPLEQAPDDFCFRSFYYSVDKILAAARNDAMWEEARTQGERDAAARSLPPTDEEVKARHEESLRLAEETRKRREYEAAKAARDAEDNAR